ncbi:class I SAM-dependent DNA methyltransferase [Phenylobacterium kunshanense]|uniref:site-specific DNA-methyltransferase (adenine-specific) n=1 Tax=Phenylobacterium kunshanense TaxID=1445034 RepID=A0A328B4V7_9CAUL|nr:class I SAM-dependent DNA methyltransferase [Phenylobacterium kunshanense]RAK62452.1 class I SAM-dependent DNA methyltransferase [Phenylobacterium kunshanense]
MNAADFIAKWRDSELRERQGSQEHFLDLCRLLGVPTPADEDPKGERYCFERGAEKVGGGDGWADVWRRGCFAWEYKGKHKDLNAALRQVTAYARDLENPPYLVVSDMDRIIVHTNWTNTVPKTYEVALDDLLEPAKRHLLRAVWEGSDELKPRISPQELTAKAAERFGELSTRLQDRGHEPRAVAHFLNQLVFCMFAEDADLLKDNLFTRLIKATATRPEAATRQLSELFGKMAQQGDTFFGAEFIRWFNGGLYDGAAVLPLERIDLELIGRTAEEHDWSQIDPSVFGTLFEQALSARRERKALGAHYTDREKILKIVEPVIVRPLQAEWAAALETARTAMAKAEAADAERKTLLEAAAEQMRADPRAAQDAEAKRRKALTAIDRRRTAARREAQDVVEAWLERLANFRVLDPACGSGNFLYVALHELMDIEQRAIVDAERLGLTGFLPRVGLEAVRGIELDRYAAELARLTLWIGYLQWVLKKAAKPPPDPVLSNLDQIENRDALLNPDGTEAEWPAVDVIIGNPPFLGGKRLRDSLGDAAVERLFAAYKGRVPAEADLVAYWVEKGWRQVEAGRATRVGLVTTNSIRDGASRRVVDAIRDAEALEEAWADEPWAVDGADVRVSMIGFGAGFVERRLNGKLAERINSNLTSTAVDVTKAASLRQNAGVGFIGTQKGGPFDVEGETARAWLSLPLNPNGRPNGDVLRQWRNGSHLTGRWDDRWIIFFPIDCSLEEAALYEAPFAHVNEHVLPQREGLRRDNHRLRWWIHAEPRPGMWRALSGRTRFIATPRVAKHRFFVWLPEAVVPDSRLVAIARDDDLAFGILTSRLHEVWSLATCSWHGVGNDPTYNAESCLSTFPFPEGLTLNIPAADYADDPRAQAIAEAARKLNELREAWLNPPDLTVRVPEVVPGYPDRILPKDEAAAKALKARTLTNLYNERPRWLAMAHEALDAAVAAAYGWPADLSDDEILERLFALNQERAAAGR